MISPSSSIGLEVEFAGFGAGHEGAQDTPAYDPRLHVVGLFCVSDAEVVAAQLGHLDAVAAIGTAEGGLTPLRCLQLGSQLVSHVHTSPSSRVSRLRSH